MPFLGYYVVYCALYIAHLWQRNNLMCIYKWWWFIFFCTEHGEQLRRPKKLLLSQLQQKSKLRSRSLSKLGDQDTKVSWLCTSAVTIQICCNYIIIQCIFHVSLCLSLLVTKQRDPETGQQSLLFQVCSLVRFSLWKSFYFVVLKHWQAWKEFVS